MKILIIGGCGYIGSVLYRSLERAGHAVRSWDPEWYGKATVPNMCGEFTGGPIHREYEAIVYLAGYSSVSLCKTKEWAWNTNVSSFQSCLIPYLGDRPLLYASSASVYGRSGAMPRKEDEDFYPGPLNLYDLTMHTRDMLALLAIREGKKVYGLRMGTVAGASPNLRIDTVVNRMYHDWRTKGEVTVTNPETHRPILGMADLCRAVEHILAGKAEPGLYNLASFNGTIYQHGKAVSDETRKLGPGFMCVTEGEPSPYDFAVDCGKFEATGFRFTDTIGSIVAGLHAGYDGALKGVR